MDLKTLTISEARELLKSKKITVSELCEKYIDNIEKSNKEINAYIEVFSDWEDMAKEAQTKIDQGIDLPLLGIPLAIKDNILIKGKTASASSKILENYKATYDATVIKKLKDAGAVFLGRTNMDEFAMGSSTETSYYGITKNPLDISRVPGGSSGGSAAAVAMNGSLASMGTDTGGSVRQPASFCGLVGLKPTYGAVSRYGLIAMGSSLDQAGPLTKTVADNEIIFNVIRGKDELDSTSIDSDFYPAKPYKENKPIVGVPRDLVDSDAIDPEIKKIFEDEINRLKEKGYTVKDISLPNAENALAVYYILMPAEVSSNLGRYDGVKFGLHTDGKDLIDDYFKTRKAGLGKEVRRRIILGTYVLSAGYADEYYYKAKVLRSKIIKEFKEAFYGVDLIMTPTALNPAFKIGEKLSDPISMYLEDVFTVTANIVGVPAISLPLGKINKDGKDLPVGIQFMADFGREDTLFLVGKDLESK